MSHFARNIAQDLLDAIRKGREGDNDALNLLEALFDSLGEIRPSDFAPVAQSKYADTVQRMKRYVKNMTMEDDRMDQQLLTNLITLFDDYYGYATDGGRSFAFMTNVDLRKIVERDYRELQSRLISTQAWKSAVILAGSVLEATLYDQLTKDAATTQAAMSATVAPKKKGGAVRDITLDTYEEANGLLGWRGGQADQG